MGVTASAPGEFVEVRLKLVEAPCRSQGAFFARLHTAAEGLSKYRSWGQPQAVGIWHDDVITISLCVAKSDQLFESGRCSDYAEAYVPWRVLRDELEGEAGSEEATNSRALDSEVVFELAIAAGRAPLGFDVALQAYASAFRDDRQAAKLDGTAPRLSVGLRRLPPAFVAAPRRLKPCGGAAAESDEGSTPAAEGVEALGHGDMKLLLKLQVRNQELRARLGLRSDAELQGVEEQVQAYLATLGRAVLESHELKAETQLLAGRLSEAGLDFSSAARGDAAGDPEAAALAADCDAQIAELERHLVECRERRDRGPGTQELARQRQQREEELKALEDECGRLWSTLQQEVSKREERDGQLIQKLQLEKDVQDEEILKLRTAVERQRLATDRSASPNAAAPPATGLLQAEIGQLQLQVAQAHRRNAEEQEAVDKAIDEIRMERREIEDQQQLISSRHDAAATDLEAARIQAIAGARRGAERIEAEAGELRHGKEALVKEISRAQQRLQFFGEKAEQLRLENEDINDRAQNIVQSMPATVEDMRACADLAHLQDSVNDLQQQLQLQKRSEEAAAAEEHEVQRELEAARVEAAVLEERLALLKHRAGRRPPEAE